MHAVAADEADRQTSRMGVRIVVREGGLAGVVGEAGEDGRGGGVDVRGWKRDAAAAVGVKVPVRRMPRAWTGRV